MFDADPWSAACSKRVLTPQADDIDVLLRYLSYVSKWAHSFTRLFTILRAVLWSKLDLLGLLGCYGTAKGSFRNLARPEQAYFPGFL